MSKLSKYSQFIFCHFPFRSLFHFSNARVRIELLSKFFIKKQLSRDHFLGWQTSAAFSSESFTYEAWPFSSCGTFLPNPPSIRIFVWFPFKGVIMRKLNPITALYLKILELISFLLIEVGGKIDDFVDTKNSTPEQIKNCNKNSKIIRKILRSWGHKC